MILNFLVFAPQLPLASIWLDWNKTDSTIYVWFGFSIALPKTTYFQQIHYPHYNQGVVLCPHQPSGPRLQLQDQGFWSSRYGQVPSKCISSLLLQVLLYLHIMFYKIFLKLQVTCFVSLEGIAYTHLPDHSEPSPPAPSLPSLSDRGLAKTVTLLALSLSGLQPGWGAKWRKKMRRSQMKASGKMCLHLCTRCTRMSFLISSLNVPRHEIPITEWDLFPYNKASYLSPILVQYDTEIC